MTTNKKKVGTHFYESHNVKNKNRNRGKPAGAPGGKSPSGKKSPAGKGRK
jgi:nuclear GTP-binding protein